MSFDASPNASGEAAAVDPKVVATLRARLALAGGFELIESPDGFIVRRWNSWTQHCSSLAQVEEFAARVERMK
jgi:hypothetical protein